MQSNKLVNCVCYQPIVDVRRQVIGYECLARMTGGRSPETAIREMTPGTQDNFADHLIRVISTETSRQPMVDGLVGSKLFVNFEKNNLANPNLVDQIMFLSDFLAAQKVTLVVEITERDLHIDLSRRAYLEGVRRLNLLQIPVALDDFLFEESSRIELEFGLCSIVKVEVNALPGRLENILDVERIELLERVQQRLSEFKLAYGVELLLEKVEGVSSFEQLLQLPFSYYQGFKFGSTLYSADFASRVSVFR